MIIKETISNSTKQELENFIHEHADKILTYHERRTAIQLRNKVMSELFDSTKGYGQEFDKIISNYKKEVAQLDESRPIQFDIQVHLLYQKFNRELSDLTSRYLENTEIRELVDQLTNLYVE